MTRLSPAQGPPAGGNSVGVTGTGFATATSGVDGVLVPGGSITGTVSGPGGPLGGICVTATGTAIPSYRFATSSIATATLGQYTLASLDSDAYTLHFSDCTGTESHPTLWYPALSTPPVAGNVSVTAGAVTSGINVTMATVATGSISGTVTTTAGVAIATGIHVSVSGPTSRALSTDVAPAPSPGHFQVTGLQPGTYTLDFNDYSGPGNYASTAVSSVVVASGADTPITVPMPLSGHITGTVTSTAGATVATACLHATGTLGGVGYGSANSAGAYSIGGLYPDTYSVLVTPCGVGANFLSATSPPAAVVSGGPGTVVNLTVAPGAQISGLVTNAFGSRLPDICATAGSGTVHTAADGSYTISSLATGTVSVRFSDCTESSPSYPNLTLAGVVVTAGLLTPGVNANLGVPVTGGGIITGHVTDQAGVPVGGACVGVHSLGTGSYGSATTDLSGNYRITGLLPGAYEVEFAGCGAGNYADQWYRGHPAPSTDTVTVLAPTTTTVSLSSGAAPWFVGVVSDTYLVVGMPAGTGVVDLTVTSPFGTSAVAATDRYTYTTPPAVGGVVPRFAYTGSSVNLVITGTNFAAPATVTVGGQAATSVSVVSPTQITASIALGTTTGPQDVIVTVAGAPSAAVAADRLTVYRAPTISTLAGGPGPLSGRATSIVQNPQAIYAVGSTVYQAGDCVIRKIDLSVAPAVETLIAGNGVCAIAGDGGLALNAQVGLVQGIFVNPAGDIFFTELNGGGAVRRIDHTSHLISGLTTGTHEPDGIVVDAAGNVFYTEHAMGQVRELVGGSGSSIAVVTGLNIAGPLAIDPAGNIYVGELGLSRVSKIAAPISVASIVTILPTQDASAVTLGWPYGLAADAAGNLLIGDYGDHIWKYAPGASTLTRVSGTGRLPGGGVNPCDTLLGPGQVSSVAFGGGSTLYFASKGCDLGSIALSVPATITPFLDGTAAGVNHSGDGGPATAAQLSNFTPALAADSAGNVYLLDLTDGVIRKVDSAGTITAVPLPGGLNIVGWQGLAVDPAGSTIFVSDACGMVKFTPGASTFTTVLPAVCGSGPAQINATVVAGTPGGITMDSAGNILIADSANNRIQKVTPAGVVTTPYTGGLLNTPIAVAADGLGNIYAANQGGAVIKITRLGTAFAIATPATIASPDGLVADANGNVFVADSSDSMVWEILDGGGIVPYAGTFTQRGFSGDGGPGTSAKLSSPAALAAGPPGKIYVADNDLHRVRTLTP